MRIATFLLLAGFLVSFPAFAATKSCLVSIDIGHTPDDPGAISARGVTELHYNTILAERLHASLEKRGIASIVLHPDAGEPLHVRAQRAEKAGATLFISLHHDSTPARFLSTWQWQGHEYSYSDRSSGYSLFVSALNPYYKESLRLAEEIGGKLSAAGLTPNLTHTGPEEHRTLLDKTRGVYQYNDLVVLMLANMPAILVESGVIVNRTDELRVRTTRYQDKIISAIDTAAADHCGRIKD